VARLMSISSDFLLYGLEALPLNKSQLASLDFVVNRFFMRLFKTTDMQVVKMCREHFDFVEELYYPTPLIVFFRRSLYIAFP